MTVTYPTLEHIAEQARPYPAYLLEGCKTGLCLFSAAFLGHNDAIHFAEAGVDTTCVDIDGGRLAEMSGLYPGSWRFEQADAWEFSEKARKGKRKWDVVSVDTFTGDAMRRSMESLDLWCSIARKAVVATATGGTVRTPPEGWEWSLMRRTGVGETESVYWMVLTREA